MNRKLSVLQYLLPVLGISIIVEYETFLYTSQEQISQQAKVVLDMTTEVLTCNSTAQYS